MLLSAANRGTWFAMAALVAMASLSVLLGWLVPNACFPDLANRLNPPSLLYPLGTAVMGQNLLVALLVGLKTDLWVAGLTVAIACATGCTVGVLAANAHPLLRILFLRIGDGFLAIPPIIPALIVGSFVSRSGVALAFALALTWWPWYARLIYARLATLRDMEFVSAARLSGLPMRLMLWRHFVPFCIRPISIQVPLDLAYAIIAISTFGFLGIGVAHPTCEWGVLLSDSRAVLLHDWWVGLFPSAFLIGTSLIFVALGAGLRRRLGQEDITC